MTSNLQKSAKKRTSKKAIAKARSASRGKRSKLKEHAANCRICKSELRDRIESLAVQWFLTGEIIAQLELNPDKPLGYKSVKGFQDALRNHLAFTGLAESKTGNVQALLQGIIRGAGEELLRDLGEMSVKDRIDTIAKLSAIHAKYSASTPKQGSKTAETADNLHLHMRPEKLTDAQISAILDRFGNKQAAKKG